MTLNPTRHVNKKLNQPKDKISTISMTVKIMNQIDELIDAPGGWPIRQIGRLQQMPYEMKLSATPAGFAAERCEGPAETTVYVKGLFTPESGPLFYKMLDGLARGYLDLGRRFIAGERFEPTTTPY